jgi:predicted DNA repair protein MutK
MLQKIGAGILWLAPYLMKTLSVLGTLAMFLVGGGILTHGFTPVYDAIHHFAEGFNGVVALLLPTVADGLFGVLAGAVLVAVITPLVKWWQQRSA